MPPAAGQRSGPSRRGGAAAAGGRAGRRAGRKLLSSGVERGGQGVGVGQGGISSGKCVLAAVGRALPRRSPRFSPQPPGARRLPPVRSPNPRGARGRRGPRLSPPGAVVEGEGLPPLRSRGLPAGAAQGKRPNPRRQLRVLRTPNPGDGGEDAGGGFGETTCPGAAGAERRVSGLCRQAGGAAPRPARLLTMLDGLKMEETLQSALDPAAPFSSLLGKSGSPGGWSTVGGPGQRGVRGAAPLPVRPGTASPPSAAESPRRPLRSAAPRNRVPPSPSETKAFPSSLCFLFSSFSHRCRTTAISPSRGSAAAFPNGTKSGLIPLPRSSPKARAHPRSREQRLTLSSPPRGPPRTPSPSPTRGDAAAAAPLVRSRPPGAATGPIPQAEPRRPAPCARGASGSSPTASSCASTTACGTSAACSARRARSPCTPPASTETRSSTASWTTRSECRPLVPFPLPPLCSHPQSARWPRAPIPAHRVPKVLASL